MIRNTGFFRFVSWFGFFFVGTVLLLSGCIREVPEVFEEEGLIVDFFDPTISYSLSSDIYSALPGICGDPPRVHPRYVPDGISRIEFRDGPIWVAIWSDMKFSLDSDGKKEFAYKIISPKQSVYFENGEDFSYSYRDFFINDRLVRNKHKLRNSIYESLGYAFVILNKADYDGDEIQPKLRIIDEEGKRIEKEEDIFFENYRSFVAPRPKEILNLKYDLDETITPRLPITHISYKTLNIYSYMPISLTPDGELKHRTLKLEKPTKVYFSSGDSLKILNRTLIEFNGYPFFTAGMVVVDERRIYHGWPCGSSSYWEDDMNILGEKEREEEEGDSAANPAANPDEKVQEESPKEKD